jgi:DNA-binding PadR family transcriptional regulator
MKMHSKTGHLKILVLTILNERPMSGYALMKEIERRTGFWRPSPGSIYPLLKSLEDGGMITAGISGSAPEGADGSGGRDAGRSARRNENSAKAGTWSSGKIQAGEKRQAEKKPGAGRKQTKKPYSLTPLGKRHYKKISEKTCRFVDEMIENLRFVQTITGDNMAFIIEMLEGLRKMEVPFKGVHKEMAQLRNEFSRLHIHSDETHHGEIKKILRKTVAELRKIKPQKS